MRPSDTDVDKQLLAHAERRWLKVARVIGQVMMENETSQSLTVEVLIDRLRHLVAAKKLELRGDLSRPRYSEVRIPLSD